MNNTILLILIFIIFLGILFSIYFSTHYIKCKGCGVRRSIPKDKDYKNRYCKTKGCYWMIFNNGTQLEDGPEPKG